MSSVRVRRLMVVVALAASLLSTSTVGRPPVTGAAAPGAPLRVLGVGDSFSAGEGMPDGIQVGEAACQRALGDQADGGRTPARAWPVLVKDALKNVGYNVDPFWFTACTGNTSRNFKDEPTEKGVTQWAETGAADQSFDVVMFTFGGNDVGFADIIRDCAGVPTSRAGAEDYLQPEAWFGTFSPLVPVQSAPGALGLFAGCRQSEAELNTLIDATIPGALDHLFAQVDAAVAADGLVVVAGYPQLFAEPSQWGSAQRLVNRCNRISEGDVRSLRSATAHLNQVIGAAVAAHDATSAATWRFVDVAAAFDDPNGDGPATGTDSHGLCGAGTDWINGIGYYPTRPGALLDKFNASYHPNQEGHHAYANRVLEDLAATSWTPGVGRAGSSDSAVPGRGTDSLTSQVITLTTRDGWQYEIEIAEPGHVTFSKDIRFAAPGRAAVRVTLDVAPEISISSTTPGRTPPILEFASFAMFALDAHPPFFGYADGNAVVELGGTGRTLCRARNGEAALVPQEFDLGFSCSVLSFDSDNNQIELGTTDIVAIADEPAVDTFIAAANAASQVAVFAPRYAGEVPERGCAFGIDETGAVVWIHNSSADPALTGGGFLVGCAFAS